LVRKFHVFSVIGGVLLFGFLVYHIGPASLWEQLSTLGGGLALLAVMDGAADLFHAQAFRYCLSGPHRSLPFVRILSIRMSGSAINYLTPTAGFGGEVTKGVLLSGRETGALAASAVIVDKLSLALAQLLFVAAGGFAILPRLTVVPHGLVIALITGTVLLSAGIGTFLVLQWQGRLGSVVRWAVTHNVGGKSAKKAAHYMTDVDSTLRFFYRSRPLDLPLSIVWHLMGMAWGVVPAYLFLVMLTGDASLFVAGAVLVLGTWFNMVTFAVPADIGVQEASRLVVFTLLGYSSALGLTYGIALRIEQLVWAGLGLLVYALLVYRMGTKARGAADRELSTRGGAKDSFDEGDASLRREGSSNSP
jgi:hypothetical protein